MGWLDSNTHVTEEGEALLASERNSIPEQALLVAGLLEIEATDGAGNAHHPVATMLRLLAIQPSFHRHGLELALEPLDDSEAEFDRVATLYRMSAADRIAALGISEYQRDNAVKILPSLALTAGLIVEDNGHYALSQDGASVIGQSPPKARERIAQHRGRRTTVGRIVSATDVAGRADASLPRTLTEVEQKRAAMKRAERTVNHQALVKRVAVTIGDGRGDLWEDEFSYDLVWLPIDIGLPIYLFEMKTITSSTDAYARVRQAVAQLSYYEFFHVAPSVEGRSIQRVAAFDARIPEELVDYLSHEGIAVLVSSPAEELAAANPLGRSLLDLLQETLGAS